MQYEEILLYLNVRPSLLCSFLFSFENKKAQKVWIALETLEVSYNMEEISLYGSGGKPDWFLKLNPKGTVPVLVVGQEASMKSRQRCFTDSDEILTQLGKDALPGGSKLCPTEKEMKITEFRSKMNQFLPIGKRAVLGGNKDSMWSTLVELDRLIEGPHICGDIVTIADCAAFPFLWRIENEFGDLDKKGCHKIKAWLTTCKGNDAFSTTIQKSWWWWW